MFGCCLRGREEWRCVWGLGHQAMLKTEPILSWARCPLCLVITAKASCLFLTNAPHLAGLSEFSESQSRITIMNGTTFGDMHASVGDFVVVRTPQSALTHTYVVSPATQLGCMVQPIAPRLPTCTAGSCTECRRQL